MARARSKSRRRVRRRGGQGAQGGRRTISIQPITFEPIEPAAPPAAPPAAAAPAAAAPAAQPVDQAAVLAGAQPPAEDPRVTAAQQKLADLTALQDSPQKDRAIPLVQAYIDRLRERNALPDGDVGIEAAEQAVTAARTAANAAITDIANGGGGPELVGGYRKSRKRRKVKRKSRNYRR